MFELDHSNDQEISYYRLQWPILEFQSVKGVHIRSCEAGNVLSSFRCSIGATVLALSRPEKSSPFYVSLSTRIPSYSIYVAAKNLSSLKYGKYARYVYSRTIVEYLNISDVVLSKLSNNLDI